MTRRGSIGSRSACRIQRSTRPSRRRSSGAVAAPFRVDDDDDDDDDDAGGIRPSASESNSQSFSCLDPSLADRASSSPFLRHPPDDARPRGRTSSSPSARRRNHRGPPPSSSSSSRDRRSTPRRWNAIDTSPRASNRAATARTRACAIPDRNGGGTSIDSPYGGVGRARFARWGCDAAPEEEVGAAGGGAAANRARWFPGGSFPPRQRRIRRRRRRPPADGPRQRPHRRGHRRPVAARRPSPRDNPSCRPPLSIPLLPIPPLLLPSRHRRGRPIPIRCTVSTARRRRHETGSSVASSSDVSSRTIVLAA